MKGQSLVIWHVIAVSISIMVIMFAVISMNNIRANFESFVGQEEIKQSCLIVKGAVEKAYQPSDYSSPSNATLARIRLSMPLKIANSDYRVFFVNHSINVVLLGAQTNYTCPTGINVTFSGSISGGPALVEWIRLDNSTDLISIAQVDS